MNDSVDTVLSLGTRLNRGVMPGTAMFGSFFFTALIFDSAFRYSIISGHIFSTMLSAIIAAMCYVSGVVLAGRKHADYTHRRLWRAALAGILLGMLLSSNWLTTILVAISY